MFEEWSADTLRIRVYWPGTYGMNRATQTMTLTENTSLETKKNSALLGAIQRVQLRESDIISFHNYSNAADFEKHVRWLQRYKRPIICTEYMARSEGSTFGAILPVAKRLHVAAINWG